jgi:hypothetical protein
MENLAKAIRQRESGGNFDAVGDAGTVSLPSGRRPKKSNSVELFRRQQ